MSIEQKIVKWSLVSVGILFILIMLILPIVAVITFAFRDGLKAYWEVISDEYTVKALILTLQATFAAVVFNTVFGIIAAWTLTRFQFRGRHFITTLIEIPFAVSPVIAGLIFVLTFGRLGWMYDTLNNLGIQVVFAVPGIILATIFVTFPFVAREVLPVLQSQGKEEEEAAALMGANIFKIFSRITLPKMKWALVYGVVLCLARAMGEFGAVSVISGHLRGKTNTLPLHVEILYNEFKLDAAFAVSSILMILAILVLILRNVIEYRMVKEEGRT